MREKPRPSGSLDEARWRAIAAEGPTPRKAREVGHPRFLLCQR